MTPEIIVSQRIYVTLLAGLRLARLCVSRWSLSNRNLNFEQFYCKCSKNFILQFSLHAEIALNLTGNTL